MEVEDLESIKRRPREEQNVQVRFNQVAIPIRFGRFTLGQIMDRMEYLETRLQQLESEHASEKIKINDTEAQKMIIDYIQSKKDTGITKINVFDMSHDLDLPVDQINRIMHLLKSKGAKEID